MSVIPAQPTRLRQFLSQAAHIPGVTIQFFLNDEFAERLRHPDQEHDGSDERRQRRVPPAWVERPAFCAVPCVAGCPAHVAINYEKYHPKRSEYLICHPDCRSVRGAHKACLTRQMAAEGWPAYSFKCPSCGCTGISMEARFRLSPSLLPWTTVQLCRFATRHLIMMPFIFMFIYYGLLYIMAWFHYRSGAILIPPTNPFRVDYTLVSKDDPNFIWEVDTWFRKWTMGFAVYLVMGTIWYAGAHKMTAWARRIGYEYQK